MNEILSLAILLTEILMVLECLQIAFRQELQFDKYMVGIIITDILVYIGINYKYIPMFSVLLIYILIYWYCYYKFKENHKKTIIGLIIGFTLASCLEVITASVTNLFEDIQRSIYSLFLSSVLALILSYIIKSNISLIKSEKEKLQKGSR